MKLKKTTPICPARATTQNVSEISKLINAPPKPEIINSTPAPNGVQ